MEDVMPPATTVQGTASETSTSERLIRSSSWLGHGARDELLEAIIELDALAEQARERHRSATPTAETFYGLVSRLDVFDAEIDGADGSVIYIARDSLERQHLATIGAPVALLQEKLYDGGTYSRPMPAVALEVESADSRGPFDFSFLADGVWPADELPSRDAAWIARRRDSRPVMLTAGPLRVA